MEHCDLCAPFWRIYNSGGRFSSRREAYRHFALGGSSGHGYSGELGGFCWLQG